ncbi:ABC transporter permease, partial [bacterium]|nr:ABC transporter permease [bacterium]
QIPSALFPIHMGLMTLISVTGIILGLFFSSVVRSSVAAYNLVPLILIPQIILGGAFLPFENMGNNIFLGAKNEEKAVPLPAQLMPSRWAYEMLINANYEFHPLKKIEDTEQAERREKNKELMELRKKGKISVLRKADLINAISKKYEKQRQQFEGTQNRSITEFNHRPRGEFLSRQHSTAEVFWENSRLKKTLEKTWLRNLLVLLLFTVLTYLLAMVSMTKQMNRKT